MAFLRDIYFAVFRFWFRLDRFTIKPENRALKATAAVTVVEGWIVAGCFIWLKLLVHLPRPSREIVWLALPLFYANHHALCGARRWEKYEREFQSYSPDKRAEMTVVGAAIPIVSFVLLLVGAAVTSTAR